MVVRRDYSLGPYIKYDSTYATLRHVVNKYQPAGTALEFGVGGGSSTRIIAEHMPVVGFDWFNGLPETWRDGFIAGAFRVENSPVIPNVTIVNGLFDHTLPHFSWSSLGPVGLVHIDCDLYSSTKTVLQYAPLLAGTYVVFDEWHGFDTCEEHEQKAFKEHAADHNLSWQVLGHSREAWAIQIV